LKMGDFSTAMVVFWSVNLVICVAECSVWRDFMERLWIRADVWICRSSSGSNHKKIATSKSEGSGRFILLNQNPLQVAW